MRRVDLIVLPDEYDGTLWYLDGGYVGHEGQWEVESLVWDANPVQVELHSWRLKDDLPDEEVEAVIWGRRPFAGIEDRLVLGVR